MRSGYWIDAQKTIAIEGGGTYLNVLTVDQPPDRRLAQILPIVFHHRIESVGNGDVFGDDFHAGKLLLGNITARNHPAHVLDKHLALFGQHMVDKNLTS